ncbi:Aste57867_22738 [Aphanomyces stellatus]|uniref:Aste57867_22738 protein n=1 Tax=Aphanomyces stellatus TaxID=120398 RepID=A0A485LKR5_9STRA|nr:hypothetical protein As57867_022668 [Aphanomyces stellatus]VFT99391.1 Aste57867_22738 [Aphanomyces stellatus]
MGKFIVIGGGPVGCLAALHLAKQGHTITIYEGRSEIPNDPSQSYPIGANPRGLHAIEVVAPDVAARIRTDGRLIDAWEIYAGSRRVAKQASGVVVGTSRGSVNLHLWAACAREPSITLAMNHRLRSMDFTAQTLEFDVGATSVTIGASDARVIGADGVHSTVRRLVAASDATFEATVTPWVNEYRVLFGSVGHVTAALDPAVHYIFSGGYTATIDRADGQLQWTLVTTVRESDDDASASQLVRETDASPANIARLKGWINRLAPAFAPLVPDAEYAAYFTRRTYRGAVVECNRFHSQDNWVVLVGDAAHSVLPPTGEGINSGLEDCLVLATCVALAPCDEAWSRFTTRRQPDIHALQVYATHLNTAPSFAGERIARVLFLIAEGATNASIGHNLFGPDGAKRQPYKRIVDVWAWKRLVWLNLARLVTYPIAAIVALLTLPISLVTRKESTRRRRQTQTPALERGVV